METSGFPEWLPHGWTMELKTQSSGKKYKCYIHNASGKKFYSKISVIRYIESEAGSPSHGTPDQISQDNETSLATGVTPLEMETPETLECLPQGLIMELKTKKSGKKYKVARKRGVSKRRSKTTAPFNKKKSNEHFLPEEVVFHILVWLPADVLYNCMRYVCRKWYDIIRSPLFIKEHLLRCKSGLFFQFDCHRDESHPSSLINFGELNVAVTITEIVNWRYPHLAVASGDGLVVLQYSERDLYVANLVTKQTIQLPAFCEPLRVDGCYKISLVCGGCPRSSSYKVFISYYPEESRTTIRCAIITVGEEEGSWKEISCPDIYQIHTLHVGRVIYWCPLTIRTWDGWTRKRCGFDDSFRLLLTYDVESETFGQVLSPALDYKKHEYFYMRRGTSLSLLVRVELEKNVFEVWLMSNACDPKKGFEWKKQYTFDLGSVAAVAGGGLFSRRFPEAWVSGGELVVFRNRKSGFIAHDVKSGRTFKCGGEYGMCTGNSGFFSEFAYSLVRFSSPC